MDHSFLSFRLEPVCFTTTDHLISRIRHEPEILRTTVHRLPPQDVFVFQIKIQDMIGFYQEGQSLSEPFIVDYWEHRSPHLSQDFLIPFSDIAESDRNRARHIIHKLLGGVGIPRQKRRPLLGKIFSQAMRLAKEFDSDGEYKRIPIMVELRRVYTGPIISYDEVEFEEAEVPAFEGLERIRVKETEVCAVCLDEMEAGLEGTMLPCKHIFHERCINAWLVKANLCPLCRFQLSYPSLTSPEVVEDGWN
nr:RING finger protein 165-like [Ipomoea trifida]